MNKKVTGMLLSISILLLAGCQNFSKSQEVAEQIKAAIDYANSEAYLVKIQPQKGTGNVVKPASGEALKKPNDVFDISFEPYSEYEFVYWTISSKNVPEGKTIWDYIIIDDPNKAETKVRFEHPLSDIVITPVVARRPKLLSYSPANLDTLSLKDAKIKVIFDRQMDPSSIYYDWEEIVELRNELGLQEDDFLKYEITGPSSHTETYGYKINTDHGEEYIYKNILIKNNETQENISNRFNAPYFESPTILIIQPNKNLLPEAYSYISVSLDKGFCYKIEYETVPSNQYINDPVLRDLNPVIMSKQIGLFDSTDWVYQVNNSQDSNPPSLAKCKIQYKDSNDDLQDLTTYAAGHSFDTGRDCAQNVYTFTKQKDKKIYIDLEAFDDVSGPASYFDIVLYRFYDRGYINNPNDTTTIRTDYKAKESTATYNGELDLSGYPEGAYKLNFIIYDNNGSFSIWPKTGTNNATDIAGYFIIDNDVYIDQPVIKDSSNSSSNLTMSWTPPEDFEKVSINYKEQTAGEDQWSTAHEITDIATTSYEFTSLNYATDYNFKITFEDICGNSKTVNLTDYTKPCTPSITNFSYISASQVVLSYSFNPQPSGTEYVYLACSDDQKFNSIIKKNLPSNRTQYTFSYGELKNYTYYEIRVVYKDKYTRSIRWKRNDTFGINPTFTPDE